nr:MULTISPECIES: caspase family protein [unclassified Pseudomonas]
MSLIYTNPSNQAGTHAFVVGVSAYKYLPADGEPTSSGFGIGQLNAAARSASEFAAWLLNEYHNPDAPLRSLRILLSPTLPNEQIHPDIKVRLVDDSAATLQNFKVDFERFQEDLGLNKADTAIVYVAGHGVQLTSEGAILLLNDFGRRPDSGLDCSVDIYNLRQVLRFDKSAHTQFWFVDTCRQLPEIAECYEKMEGEYKKSIPRSNIRKNSSLFLSCSTGMQAYANKTGLTFFCDALLHGLRSAQAADSNGKQDSLWRVSSPSLSSYLDEAVPKLAREKGCDQYVECQGCTSPAVLHTYKETPYVELHIDIAPTTDRQNHTDFNLRQSGKHWIENHSHWPLNTRIPAGLYSASWNCRHSTYAYAQEYNFKPPLRHVELKK